ncbi:MAG: 2-oxoglutarate dehydrogenase E1 component [Parachlamydiaceae bacterium]
MDEEDVLKSQILSVSFLENLFHASGSKELDPSWMEFFQQIEDGKKIAAPFSVVSEKMPGHERIEKVVNAYRCHGHLSAQVNPIALDPSLKPDHLEFAHLGFEPSEQQELFPTLGLLAEEKASLSKIVDRLNQLYCQSIGYEFKGIVEPVVESWIQSEIESGRLDQPLNVENKLAILDFLTKAEGLEEFLHIKHAGKKRFSLEGAESLIPMLAFLVSKGAEDGVQEFCIGMSHRGRLNVLANLLNKSISSIVQDFDEEYEPVSVEGMGDVRYHKGYVNECVETYCGKRIKLTVPPNPSHLESIYPVVEGQTYAKQFLADDEEKRSLVIPLLIHGDAAFSGQGVVYETLQMSQLEGFETGGTLHLILNNQIGFTTSAQSARSTLYCSDIAKTFRAPVFHVNCEDPEICVKIALFAFEIRQRFHCDIFIDLNCYRKYGHNEGDEPVFTQPLHYEMIRKKQSIRSLYVDQLLKESSIEKDAADERKEAFRESLRKASSKGEIKESFSSAQSFILDCSVSLFSRTETKVDVAVLRRVTDSFLLIPEGFHLHPKVKSVFQERAQLILEDRPIDWATAELLAYGTLVDEGVAVRLVGQDSGRGTFSHRHALWVDQSNNTSYFPLSHIRPGQGRFEVFNTSLSEAAALGFEYGYSTVSTRGLTIWEAQFGDFANSAQVMIDQYIASGEQKWRQTSNLVLLLPHGFEGQGPEHSSARLERFLSLAADDNMSIVNPTTPAQFFHLLRRQVKQSHRQPLVVMTPKGLLRHPSCISCVKDLTDGQFLSILHDVNQGAAIKKMLFCSGRIFYDLDAYKKKEGRDDIAIIRIEQLYPLNIEELQQVINQYRTCEKYEWVQEEPENMGAWSFIFPYLSQAILPKTAISYVGRKKSASPATGFYARHKQELAHILDQVFHT